MKTYQVFQRTIVIKGLRVFNDRVLLGVIVHDMYTWAQSRKVLRPTDRILAIVDIGVGDVGREVTVTLASTHLKGNR